MSVTHISELPAWAKGIAQNSIVTGLDLTEEQILFLRSCEVYINGVFEISNSIPNEYDWTIRSSEDFINNINRQRIKESDDTEYGKYVFGNYWHDMSVMSNMYTTLTLIKSTHLIKSAIRCFHTKEILQLALSIRALLEHTVHYQEHMGIILTALNAVSESSLLVAVNDEHKKMIEEPLVSAIWGSKIHTTNLGNPNKLLFDNADFEGSVNAKNVLTSFQKQSKRNINAKVAFKVYAILSELLHPNALGFEIYKEGFTDLTDAGSYKVTINKSGNSVLQNELYAHCLYALGYSAAILINISNSFYPIKDKLDNRLKDTYGIRHQ